MSTPIVSFLNLVEVDYQDGEELWFLWDKLKDQGCHRYVDTHLDKQVPIYKLTANLDV